MTRRVTAVVIDRANYGRLLPVLQALRADDRFHLQLILGGSFLLQRFGDPWHMLRGDGLDEIVSGVPIERVYHEVEGNCPQSRAQSIGLGVGLLAAAIERQAPDYVLLIGDRYEALAAAIAAVYSGRCLVHLQGGEISGTLDESTRHAITQLAHWHVPATARAARNLTGRLGQDPSTVLAVGCPSADLAARLRGQRGEAHNRYILAMYHPSGADPGEQVDRVLAACDRLAGPGKPFGLLVWEPNIDPHSDQIARRLKFRQSKQQFTLVRHLHPVTFLELLRDASLCVGNSSALARDAGHFGTPVVLVGDRQDGRQTAHNVRRCPCQVDAIHATSTMQLHHGPYAPTQLYGDGLVTQRFLDRLARVAPYAQKRLLSVGDYQIAEAIHGSGQPAERSAAAGPYAA